MNNRRNMIVFFIKVTYKFLHYSDSFSLTYFFISFFLYTYNSQKRNIRPISNV